MPKQGGNRARVPLLGKHRVTSLMETLPSEACLRLARGGFLFPSPAAASPPSRPRASIREEAINRGVDQTLPELRSRGGYNQGAGRLGHAVWDLILSGYCAGERGRRRLVPSVTSCKGIWNREVVP